MSRARKTMVELSEGQLVAGRYLVIRVLGRGGMGSVYLVKHAETEELLALKILHQGVASDEIALERFRREAKAPARIDSDHVARVLDTGVADEADGAPFLVMEYLRGDNFLRISERAGPLPFEEVVSYAIQIARGLDKAHSIGIVHRDIKPDNLFLTRREDGVPCVKVLDFGIAKLLGQSGDLENIKATKTGDVFGTPLYMSPEQCLSEIGDVSAASDIWSLGLICHRLLTGEDFWQAKNLTHLIGLIAYEPIPAPSDVGCDFGVAYDAWFARCCAREPSKRFATASEAVDALAESLGVIPARSSSAGQGWRAVSEAKMNEINELALTKSALTRTGHPTAQSTGYRRWAWTSVAVAAAIGLFWVGSALVRPWMAPASAPAAASVVPERPSPPNASLQEASPQPEGPGASPSSSAASSAAPSASAASVHAKGQPAAAPSSANRRPGNRVRAAAPVAVSASASAARTAAPPSASVKGAPAPVDPLAGRH